MTVQTPPVARVVRVFASPRVGRMIRVTCPYECPAGEHEHPWRPGDRTPSREVAAPCGRPPRDFRSYAICPASARAALARAPRHLRR